MNAARAAQTYRYVRFAKSGKQQVADWLLITRSAFAQNHQIRAKTMPQPPLMHLDDDRQKLRMRLVAELWFYPDGSRILDDALALRSPGPYQMQAAIAALHARAPRPEDTDWP